jgi:DNA-binding MurR/RpiR family transcriptional regulator
MSRQTDVIELIRTSYDSLSKGHKRIADYIMRNYDRAVTMTAAVLGETAGVSESTVVRFATKLGFSGYPQFQKALSDTMKWRFNSVQRIFLADNRLQSKDMVHQILTDDIQNLRRTDDMIDRASFDKAVDLLCAADRIYVVGGRSCAMLASFFSYYLSYISDNVRLIKSDSFTESIEDIRNISSQDVIVGISYPRYSMKTVTALEYAHRRNAHIIALTDSEQSPLTSLADCCIFARSDMTSFVDSLVAPLSVINALLAALSIRRKDSVIKTMESLETLWSEMNEYEHSDQ